MKQSATNNYLFETSVNAMLVVAAVGVVFFLFYFDPVYYNLLVAEDNVGEYCTSVSFALSGFLMIILSFKCGTCLQKLLWVLIGICFIIVSAEEISWGQRIFSLSTPDQIKQINLQNEITLHNLKSASFINIILHKIVAYMILVWLSFSIIVHLILPRLEVKIRSIGLPLVSFNLIPIFLVPLYFFLFFPIIKSDEIGETFFGIAIFALSLDMFLDYGYSKRWLAWNRVLVVKVGMLFLIVIIAIALAYLHNTFLGRESLYGRMNRMVLNYDRFGMYDHAQEVFDHILARPKYIRTETMVNHGKMLLNAGRSDEASQILKQAIDLLNTRNTTQEENCDHFLELGTIFMLLGLSDQAESNFSRVIEIGNLQLMSVSDPDIKAKLLWPIAQAIEGKGGDTATAINKAMQAKRMTSSGRLKSDIDKWINSLDVN